MYESTKQQENTTSRERDTNRSQRDESFNQNAENQGMQGTLEQVTNQAKQTLTDTVDEVKQQATSKLSQQKQQTAERLSGIANALRSTGQDLHDQDETVAQYVDSFASQIERISGYIQNRDIGELFNDAQQLARRQPELFVAGALAAGFLVGRFFKSSSTPSYNRYNERYSDRYNNERYNDRSFGRGQYDPALYAQNQVSEYGGQPQYDPTEPLASPDAVSSSSQYPYDEPASNRQEWQNRSSTSTPDVSREESEEPYAR